MSEHSENDISAENTSAAKHSLRNYLGLEWKDFLSLSIAGLALVISLWTSMAQYIDANITKAKQHRQLSYVVTRMGNNLAAAYSTYIDFKGTVTPSREGALIASELASIGIRLPSSDIDFTELHVTDTFKYSNATSFYAFEQISDLLDAHHGADIVALFEARYLIELADLALVSKRSDEKGDDSSCGLWIVYAAPAYEKIRASYGLPPITPNECKETIARGFQDKLTLSVKTLEAALANRMPLVGDVR